VQWAWQRERRVYLPVTRPPRDLTFARWHRGDAFARSRFGIDEPLPTARRVATTRLDVVLVPLVAFDRRGNRLGHGAGYYDAAFAFRLAGRRRRPLLIGLAHAFQELPQIDAQSWDVPLDLVVTEDEVVDFTGVTRQ
jgi:5-formyltetrahydrofolate cyclo-ligase